MTWLAVALAAESTDYSSPDPLQISEEQRSEAVHRDVRTSEREICAPAGGSLCSPQRGIELFFYVHRCPMQTSNVIVLKDAYIGDRRLPRISFKVTAKPAKTYDKRHLHPIDRGAIDRSTRAPRRALYHNRGIVLCADRFPRGQTVEIRDWQERENRRRRRRRRRRGRKPKGHQREGEGTKCIRCSVAGDFDAATSIWISNRGPGASA